MRRSIWAVALATAGLVGAASLRVSAADEKATGDKPAATSTEKPAKKGGAKSMRIVKPWSEMTSLSDDQKSKIADIHKKSLEEKKAIDQKEHESIMALLNDDQKAEAEKLTASAKKGMKKDAAAGETAAAAEKSPDSEKKAEK
jgi:Spy/CpxP family protein refolding chaperone